MIVVEKKCYNTLSLKKGYEMLSNDDLKAILEKRVAEFESSDKKEARQIDETYVQNLLKLLSLPNDFLPIAKRAFEITPKLNVIWLHLAECTGCSESFFRTDRPDFANLVFDFISLNYHETIMCAAGWQADECIEDMLDSNEDFVLAVEGGVAAIDTYFLTIGAHAESAYDLLQRLAKKAKAVFAMGTCSSYGGVQAAMPNPSKCCGISEVLSNKVVNVPGCPPSDINIVANLAFYALFRVEPNLDENNRPKWAYGKCLHDMCERKAKFESGIFAQKFDDDLAKNGACLFKVGCKGPYTYNNCPKVKFNSKTSWPVQAGHGCMACCEPNFWDDFGFYELAMSNKAAYKDYSFNSLNISTMKEDSELNDTNILLSINDSLQILNKSENQALNLLNLSFESNVKLILQSIAKNKMGASLLETYKKEFPKNYTYIEENFDEESRPSSNIFDFFSYIYVLAKGEKLQSARDFLEAGASYKFKHASPFDMKLSCKENEAKLDISKSMRMPLIYLCGGLDLEALAFSASKELFKNLNEALLYFVKNTNKSKALFVNSDYKHPFLYSYF